MAASGKAASSCALSSILKIDIARQYRKHHRARHLSTSWHRARISSASGGNGDNGSIIGIVAWLAGAAYKTLYRRSLNVSTRGIGISARMKSVDKPSAYQ